LGSCFKVWVRIFPLFGIVVQLLAVDAGTLVHALRVVHPPTIDGKLDERTWQKAVPATDFATLQPENKVDARLKNKMWFAFDDANLYVAAELEAASSDSILRQLGERDNANVTADWFGVWISPYNDKANDIVFRVTAAGVQLDHKSGPNHNDESWDPVWKSAILIHETGWSVEFAIPFSQIRFPTADKQVWGINAARWVQATREVFTWTFIEKDHSNYSVFGGELHGIENIEPPLRLSFTPYTAASLSHFPFDEGGKSNWSRTIRGGLDLKYGINESFTLDLTLIPDFGEVQSDNVVLNLTPFEVRYNERRPFFTEGTDLLSKAGRFYSRRVGARPIRFWDVYDLVEYDSLIIDNPEEAQMINATKITGQNANGIGLAFFNATTGRMQATYLDSLGEQREFLTDPITNFNRIVVNKNFGNGSELGISNSNVFRGENPDDDTFENDFRDANVTGISARLVSRDSQWRIQSSAAYSQISQGDSMETGNEWNLRLSENNGAFRYGVSFFGESDTYDPNDLGFMFNNNSYSQSVWLSLFQHEPKGLLNDAHIDLRAMNQHLYKPREFTGTMIRVNWKLTTRKYFSNGGGIQIRPTYSRDYYEPRSEEIGDQFFLQPPFFHIHSWISTDYNRPFAFDLWLGVDAKDKFGSSWTGGGFKPRWRISDQLMFNYSAELKQNHAERGFAEFDDDDDPVFGRRERREVTNMLTASYTVSNTLSSNIRIRHYWSQVVYDRFYDLQGNGELDQRAYTAELDGILNVFNIDAVLVWRFAPGSELNLIWKNSIDEWTEGIHGHHYIGNMHADYIHDLGHILEQPQANSLSVKILYYVDWWDLRNRF